MKNSQRAERKQANQKKWQRLLEEWSVSGLSQAAFCREKGIKVNNFYGWYHRLMPRKKTSDKKHFLPVHLPEVKSKGSEACGVTLHFSPTMPLSFSAVDPVMLAGLLKQLGVVSC